MTGKGLILLLMGLFLYRVDATSNLNLIWLNNQGILALQKKNNFLAYQTLLKAIEKDSFNPVLRLNLGIIYLANKENSKALQEFKIAEEYAGSQKEIRFQARFNQAIVLAENGDIPGALKSYQSALALDPNAISVKTNIELLWQKGGSSGKQGDKKDSQQKEKGDQEGKSEEQKNEKNKSNKTGDEPKEKPKPKPFSSRDMTPETVDKILDELKSQEQRVRAEHYSKGQKERPRDKDW
ncbi:MAG: hypothetical protein K1X29_06975 [Bdellovibrionales bacterium]|nr:hypothetical protein [Bdellovibrionales bacterium]